MKVPSHPLITADPQICGGKPTVDGTRLRAMDVLAMLGEGVTQVEIVQD